MSESSGYPVPPEIAAELDRWKREDIAGAKVTRVLDEQGQTTETILTTWYGDGRTTENRTRAD